MTNIRTTLAFLIILAPAALAQNAPNVDRVSQDRVWKKAPPLAPASADAGSSEIPFDAILAKPGDIDLNERFARQQIEQGDLRGAATTLERILILAPDRDRVRLLYAAVLIRLDSLTEAERELATIVSHAGAHDIIEQAKAFQKVVAGKRRRMHFDARLSVGFNYDSNRNSAADSDQNLFFGTPVLLNPDSRRQDDTAVTFAGSLGAHRDMGGAKPWQIFADAGYYRGEQTRINSLDLQAYSADVGFSFRFKGWDITPQAGFDHVLLAQQTYLRSPSQGLRVARKVRPTVNVFAEVRHEDQKFVKTRLIPTATDRTGDQYDAALGAQWIVSPRDRFGFTLGHRIKRANNWTLAYRRESAGLDYTRLLGKGRFLALGLSGQFDRYAEADVTTFSRARADDAMIFSMMYGMPLDGFWKHLNGFSATVGYERFQQTSNILNYDYSNDRLSAAVAYKWGI